MKLVFGALTMPKDIVEMDGPHDFVITDRGVALYNFKFGKRNTVAVPTPIADAVICLPDLSQKH